MPRTTPSLPPRSAFWSACLVGCLRALLVAVSAPVAAAFQAPAQPTDILANHRDGQTFLTWTASADVDVGSYQVYRHTEPITDLNLGAATPIWEVTAGSSLFFADRYLRQSDGTWEPRYLERYVIEDGGPELGANDELLVWTIAEADVGPTGSGDGYYAVTSIRTDGTENTTTFDSGNTTAAVAESIAPPRPVVGMDLPLGNGQVLVQYLDLREVNPTFAAPNARSLYYGLDPVDPRVSEGFSYAYTYVVYPPDVDGCTVPAADYPVVLVLHGHGGLGLRPYTTFEPDPDWCNAYRIYPIDPMNSWWFGYADQNDYRVTSVPSFGDTVRNFTEQRVLRMVDDLIAKPIDGLAIDSGRVFVTGHSMGATGALAYALRYPQVFAASYASQPMTKPSTAGDAGGTLWEDSLSELWGEVSDALPYKADADQPYQAPLLDFDSTPAWNWQDHLATLSVRSSRERVPLGVDHGVDDTIIEWPTQGEPFYAPLDQAAVCYSAEVTGTGHITSNQVALIGSLESVFGRPFANFTAVRDETVPGFLGALSNSPLPPTMMQGAYNTDFEWSASWNNWDGLPVDTADEWRISVRTSGLATQVQVAPRRTQVFEFEPGDVLRWENESIETPGMGVSGTLIVPSDGVALLPYSDVTPIGNRIGVQRTLVADVEQISLSAGGTQQLDLRCGADLAGSVYIVLGSFAGTSPGLSLVDGSRLPLALTNPNTGAPDPYFNTTLAAPNQPFLTPSFATLGAEGEATCVFSLPPNAPAALAGVTLHHAFAIVDPIALAGLYGSNAVAVELVP